MHMRWHHQDNEQRGIMRERHAPRSAEYKGMLASWLHAPWLTSVGTLEHSPPFTLKLHEGSALTAGKAAVLFYSEKLRGDVVFSL
jgi:hypothetical protein